MHACLIQFSTALFLHQTFASDFSKNFKPPTSHSHSNQHWWLSDFTNCFHGWLLNFFCLVKVSDSVFLRLHRFFMHYVTHLSFLNTFMKNNCPNSFHMTTKHETKSLNHEILFFAIVFLQPSRWFFQLNENSMKLKTESLLVISDKYIEESNIGSLWNSSP